MEQLLPQNSEHKSIVYDFPNNFFISCSGSDKELLRKCPNNEVKRHSYTGILLLFTGIFATVGGSYFFYTIFPNTYIFNWLHISIPFGILWGCFFFILDRSIIADTKALEFNKSNSAKQLLKSYSAVIVRIILALISTAFVSTNLQLAIFEGAIDYKMEKDRQYRQKVIETVSKQKQNEFKVEEANEKSNAEAEKTKVPENVQYWRDAYEKLSKEIEPLEAKNTEYINQLSENYENYSKNTIDEPTYTRTKRSINQKKTANNLQLLPKKKQLNEAETFKNKFERENVDRMANIDKYKNEKLLKIGVQKDNTEALSKVEAIREDSIFNISMRLPRRYSTLERMTDGYTEPDTLGKSKYEIDIERKENQQEENAMSKMAWGIWLLFLGLELTPIIRKIFMPKGQYEANLEANEEKHFGDLELQKQINEEIRYKTLKDAEKERLEFELKYQKEVGLLKDVYLNFEKDLKDLEDEFFSKNRQRISNKHKAENEEDKSFIDTTLQKMRALQATFRDKLIKNIITTFTSDKKD
jgi:Domain of unknown function (DUF4407)